LQRQEEVVQDSEAREQAVELKGASKSQMEAPVNGHVGDTMAQHQDFAAAWRENPVQNIDKSGLSGPVGADQGEVLARVQCERYFCQDLNPAKVLGYVTHF
jgi:hypothetical protein